MGRPSPPLSPSISPAPAQQPPTTTPPPPDLVLFLLCIPAIVFITIVAIFRCKSIWHRRSSNSDPLLAPADGTTATATDARDLIICIDDDDRPSPSPSPSRETEAGPSDEWGSCPICRGEMAEGGEEVRVLPRCRHAYHRSCVDLWLIMGSHSCPLCRDRLTVRWVERKRIDRCDDGNDG